MTTNGDNTPYKVQKCPVCKDGWQTDTDPYVTLRDRTEGVSDKMEIPCSCCCGTGHITKEDKPC
jgi:RecJ-like exonuclease